MEGQGEGLDQAWKEQLCSDTLGALEGPPWYLWEEPEKPSRQVCPSRVWTLLPAPQLHAHQPRLPEDKGLYCLHPFAWPLTSSLASGGVC